MRISHHAHSIIHTTLRILGTACVLWTTPTSPSPLPRRYRKRSETKKGKKRKIEVVILSDSGEEESLDELA
jgi:hypothetical protein